MRPPLAVLAAAASLLIVTACSGSDDAPESGSSASPSESSTVLEGAELGEAVGSEGEVPFDPGVADEGAQDSLETPAVVLVPSDDGRKTIAARITLLSATEDPENVDVAGIPKQDRAEARVYEVKYEIEYVNGPVLRNFQSVYFELTSGGEIVSDGYDSFGVSADCEDYYSVRNFGEGAVLAGCDYFVVAPDRPAPDAVGWFAPVDGAPEPQVTWPLP